MKYLQSINEKINKLEKSKKELKYFQDALDIDVTINDLMDSIEGLKLDPKSVLPSLNVKWKMKNLLDKEDFYEELDELELKLSDLNDTEELNTFARVPMKWYWVYNEEDSSLEKPVYILFKFFDKEKWSDIQVYLVQEDSSNFIEELSLVTIEIQVKTDDELKRWFYSTPDSGKSWELKTNKNKIKVDGEEKILQSDKPTSTFRAKLNWEDILYLARNVNTKLIIY